MIRNVDFDRELEDIRDEIHNAVREVIESGWYILGSEVETFERRFAEYVGVNHAIGVNSGTDALILSLKALGVEEGHEVITVSHTATATTAAIVAAGAEPVYVDVNPDTMLMDVSQVEDAITERTAAFLPVHLYGQPVAMGRLTTIADEYNVPILEDCSQAHGARYRGNQVGTFGAVGAFSLYPTKNLGAYGDAGIVVADDDDLVDTIRKMREYGWEDRYRSVREGINSRLDELQAGILNVKLNYLDEWTNRRRAIAELYDEMLADIDVRPQQTPSEVDHVYHQYVILTENRDRLASLLDDEGIQTGIHYPIPNHRQDGYEKNVRLPVTERVSRQVISLPLHPYLTDSEVTTVASNIRDT